MTNSESVRAYMYLATKEELDELRMRTVYLGYPSMGAYVSDQLGLTESMIEVDEDMVILKSQMDDASNES